MTAIILPTTTSPGNYPQESGGRLVNMFAESLGETAGSRLALRRVPGLKQFGTTGQTGYRGSQTVGNFVYHAFAGKVVSHSSAGGVGTVLGGTLPGTSPVIMARNNAATPHLVIVAPGDGAFVASTSNVSAYPDADVLQPNSVCFLKGVFVFSYGDGTMRNSDVNSTSVNALSQATAETRPDTLYRVVPSATGQLLACGSESIEFWGGQNDAGFFFSYTGVSASLGIAGPYCITGYEEGWGKGLFLIGSDNGVHRLEGYEPSKISTPDLDRLIEQVTDKTTLQISVAVAEGHPFVIVQSPTWTWIWDVSTQRWHERASYLKTRWRGMGGHKAFGKWLVGDAQSGNIAQLDYTTQTELSQPLVTYLETGPMGNFPMGARINRLDLFISVGVGMASGIDPIQTDPSIEIRVSRDNGISWSAPWIRKLGRQALGDTKVTVNNLGHAGPQGVRIRVEISDPIHVALMGGDLDLQVLGK